MRRQPNSWRVAVSLCGLFGVLYAGQPASQANDASAESAAALKSVLAFNVQHAADWLAESDYKSLAQSAGTLTLLCNLLQAKGDDPAWQNAVSNVQTKIAALQAAARSADAGQCQAALAALQQTVAVLEKSQPAGKPSAAAKPPALRPLMLSLDAIQADAKVAVLTGNVASAKQQAAALAELSSFVATARSDPKWNALAADFSQAAAAAATATETDPKAVRQLLRGVAQRCDACHENARTR